MHDQSSDLSQIDLELHLAFRFRANIKVRLSDLLAIIIALIRALL